MSKPCDYFIQLLSNFYLLRHQTNVSQKSFKWAFDQLAALSPKVVIQLTVLPSELWYYSLTHFEIVEFSDKQFLKFFFKRLKQNQTTRYAEDFPFVSPCGREMNYIRCDDVPVVFATIIEDPGDSNQSPGLLTFSGVGDMMTFPFQPEKVCMLPESGRIYHPGPEKVGGVALIKSSLAIELSPHFEYRKGNQEKDPPTHFNWKGIRYELDNSMWKCLRSAEADELIKRTF